jgi:thiol:disulfide interchange protein
LALHAAAAALPDQFDPTRDAAADVAAAVAAARSQNKRVLVDVGGEWCSWCHIMDRFFAADAEARALRDKAYVMVKVNFSPENRNEAFLSRWPRIAGYPHLFVLGPDGALLHSQDTGDLEAGKGYDRAKFLAFLEAWRPR